MSNVLILLGPPGAGKGTQAERLSSALSLPHVSTGDLFRENVKSGTDLGRKAKGFMDAGAYVPDDLVTDMLFERVAKPDARQGFLLDGFPRTSTQAKTLDARLGATPVRVLNLSVSDPAVIERLTGRWTCRSCGHVHHERFSPPQRVGVCDECGGALYQRSDDSRAVVERRLAEYREKTKPVEDHYRARGLCTDIDGSRKPDDVFASMLSAARGEVH